MPAVFSTSVSVPFSLPSLYHVSPPSFFSPSCIRTTYISSLFFRAARRRSLVPLLPSQPTLFVPFSHPRASMFLVQSPGIASSTVCNLSNAPSDSSASSTPPFPAFSFLLYFLYLFVFLFQFLDFIPPFFSSFSFFFQPHICPVASISCRGSSLYSNNVIAGWVGKLEGIRIYRAMWFSLDRNKRRVPSGPTFVY